MPSSRPAIAALAAASALTLVMLGATGGAFAVDDSGAIGLHDGSACDLLALEDLNAVGDPQYDDASAGLDTCRYSNTVRGVDSHEVEISRSTLVLDDMKRFFAGGDDFGIGGHEAYTQSGRLGVQLDDGLLEVVATFADTPGSDGLDVLDYETAVAELIVSRVDTGGSAGPSEAEPIDAGAAAQTPCEAIDLDELNAIASLEFVEVLEAGTTRCTLYSATTDEGFYHLALIWEPFRLENVRLFAEDVAELEIAGRAALSDGKSVWVETGERVLIVSPAFAGSPVSQDVDPVDFATAVAELATPRLIEE